MIAGSQTDAPKFPVFHSAACTIFSRLLVLRGQGPLVIRVALFPHGLSDRADRGEQPARRSTGRPYTLPAGRPRRDDGPGRAERGDVRLSPSSQARLYRDRDRLPAMPEALVSDAAAPGVPLSPLETRAWAPKRAEASWAGDGGVEVADLESTAAPREAGRGPSRFAMWRADFGRAMIQRPFYCVFL